MKQETKLIWWTKYQMDVSLMTAYWGYHLILDCKSGNLDQVSSAENIKLFVQELITAIDMVAYGDPVIEHFATHDKDAAGYSLVQLIETSSITGHFVDRNGDCYIDIFSCNTICFRLF